ncbi:MAG: hypothetical protein EAZ55_12725 [Cytophagales bacterium]|nr:MAG: hypothetical protein EAZ55_12725 [Cytophagales bacterium]
MFIDYQMRNFTFGNASVDVNVLEQNLTLMFSGENAEEDLMHLGFSLLENMQIEKNAVKKVLKNIFIPKLKTLKYEYEEIRSHQKYFYQEQKDLKKAHNNIAKHREHITQLVRNEKYNQFLEKDLKKLHQIGADLKEYIIQRNENIESDAVLMMMKQELAQKIMLYTNTENTTENIQILNNCL